MVTRENKTNVKIDVSLRVSIIKFDCHCLPLLSRCVLTVGLQILLCLLSSIESIAKTNMLSYDLIEERARPFHEIKLFAGVTLQLQFTIRYSHFNLPHLELETMIEHNRMKIKGQVCECQFSRICCKRVCEGLQHEDIRYCVLYTLVHTQ